ncbi:MAG: hypothetical protein IT204_16200 [Fimbriimonadaceae bacterium]|nr:hypothetical protein [Fimbriimonadaceae bacterium]
MGQPEFAAVGIVGCGVIGTSWAAWYAAQGLPVRLHDRDPATLASAVERAQGHLTRLVELDLLPAAAGAAAAARLTVAERLEALADQPLIHEAARETYEVKRPLFAALDGLTPPTTVLLSSTSGLLQSELQPVMRHPERSLTAHPFNPPHLVPLVELVPGPATAPAVVERLQAFYEQHGKVPVVVRREVPGHLANRLAAALWREALDLVASGVATVEDVDKALTAGPGLRWAVLGQHLIYHLGGGPGGYQHFIDHLGPAFAEYWRTMPTWTSIPPETAAAAVAGVNDLVGQQPTADLAARRDRRLAAVLRALREVG